MTALFVGIASELMTPDRRNSGLFPPFRIYVILSGHFLTVFTYVFPVKSGRFHTAALLPPAYLAPLKASPEIPFSV